MTRHEECTCKVLWGVGARRDLGCPLHGDDEAEAAALICRQVQVMEAKTMTRAKHTAALSADAWAALIEGVDTLTFTLHDARERVSKGKLETDPVQAAKDLSQLAAAASNLAAAVLIRAQMEARQ